MTIETRTPNTPGDTPDARITLDMEMDVRSTSPALRDPLPRWRIVTCVAAIWGIHICYSAQTNLGSSQLLQLGIGDKAVSLAWLAGPVSGLIVQPLVGHASDTCTSRFGRRRPFLVAGAFFTSLSLLLFGNARPLARLFVPVHVADRFALVIAVCAFFLMDFSIQAIQAPLRALITDFVPSDQRAFAYSYVGVFIGLGNFFGGLLSGLDLASMLPYFENNTQALFSIAAMVLWLSIIVSVVTTPEKPLRDATSTGFSNGHEAVNNAVNYDGTWRREAADMLDNEGDPSAPLLDRNGGCREKLRDIAVADETRGILQALKGIPRPFWQVFAVQLCTWCGFFTLFVYVNSWVGRNIFLGRATAPVGSKGRELFEAGVRFGGDGSALTAIVTLGYSLLLPRLLKCFGTVRVYGFSQLMQAASLMAAPMIRGTTGQGWPPWWLRFWTMVDVASYGVVWATTSTVPWALAADALESDKWYAKRIGVFTTLLNASQSLPQLVVALIAPGVLTLVGNDPAYILFLGGLCALVGAGLVRRIRVDEKVDEDAMEIV